ncbi:RNase H family protein [Vibrio navarrensis]|uniref:RNase H family protein n=1 Tax=Vibrio navarrensis TaxID=29495 RepID=UPI0009DE06C3|nr:RNase H family protein [Vibrio navarrensis]
MASQLSDIKKKSWCRAEKAQIKNRRLWQTVDVCEIQKVRAHSGIRENEVADSLAVDAARSDID